MTDTKGTSFDVHEGPLTIEGTYNAGTDTVTITETGLGGVHIDLSPPITLTGILATAFVDLFDIHGATPV